jgi:hypothetical protein
LISAEEYARLKRRDRRVIASGDLSERQIAALRDAKVPDQYTDLDREIEDWNLNWATESKVTLKGLL